LPERIEIRRIISEGGALVAEGRYDEAIKEYKQLENLGRIEKMNDKIVKVEKEKKASDLLDQAKKLIEEGDVKQAREVLDSIPANTRASREAARLKKSIKD